MNGQLQAPPGPGPPPRPVAVYAPPVEYTVEQLVASWLASASFSANTREAYGRDLRRYLSWCAGRGLDPLTLGLPEIQMFAADLADTPSPHTGKPPVPRTRARTMAAVSSWYTYLNRAGVMHYHPASEAERPRYDRRHSPTRSLTEPQARAMCALAGSRAPRTWPPLCAQLTVHLLLDLGARVTEVCSTDVGDLGHRVDHTGATWRVITLRMKGGTVRVRPLPVQLASLADAWRVERRAEPGVQALLVDRYGARISRYQVEHLLGELAKAAGVPGPEEITPHVCRRAFNNIAKAHGSDLETRQHALGHASPETTQLYTHVTDALAADPAHLVAAATFAQREE